MHFGDFLSDQYESKIRELKSTNLIVNYHIHLNKHPSALVIIRMINGITSAFKACFYYY